VPWFNKVGQGTGFPIVRCADCRSAFVWPRPDEATIANYYRSTTYDHDAAMPYDEPDPYYPEPDADARRIAANCRRLAPSDRFLDVGAGHGLFSYHARREGFDVRACEPNPNARRVFARRNGFEADPDLLDKAYAERHAGQFEVALLSQVLEHTVSPGDVIDRLHRVLGDDGLAAIAVPHFGSALSRLLGRRDIFISPPEHLNFFSIPGLISLMGRHGFVLEHVATVSKVPRARVLRAVRVPLLGGLAWRGCYAALTCCHPFKLGMVIDGYFRKARSSPRAAVRAA
jgi:SAM-dependent methyltransferase